LGTLKAGDIINLERGLRIGDRLDGHIVQGHVDETGICTNVKEDGGSWVFSFEYSKDRKNITIEKGSITINGVSLTVVDSGIRSFSVAIIPYTYKNTNFHMISKGSIVNLEFDMIGKYISKLHSSNYNK
jgi:riboflavin synthase